MNLTSVGHNYEFAVSRNRGWLTEAEQKLLSMMKVAILGCGGVGALHAISLARLGVRRFVLADPDTYELANFNRQFGSGMSTLGKSKARAVKDLILDINPEAEVEVFGRIDQVNVAAFFEGVDVLVDGIDFFELEIRRLVFAEAAKRNVPALTAAPIGWGASFMCFWSADGSMSFESYFAFGEDPEDNLLRFLVGMSPTFMHRKLLVDPTVVDFKNRKVPSTVSGCQVAASLIDSAVCKIARGVVSGKRIIEGAPLCVHQDPFLGKTRRTRRGPKNWLRRGTLRAVRKKFGHK